MQTEKRFHRKKDLKITFICYKATYMQVKLLSSFDLLLALVHLRGFVLKGLLADDI